VHRPREYFEADFQFNRPLLNGCLERGGLAGIVRQPRLGFTVRHPGSMLSKVRIIEVSLPRAQRRDQRLEEAD
jgi:hypothetical protein